MILETDRLVLREMEQSDFCDLAEILQNPKVMYAYEHDFTDNDVQVWLDRQKKRYKQYGFGLWAVILKSTKEMIGQAGLTMQPYKGTQVLEIGYLLKENFWHYGYAREAAAGCKKYAFEILNRDKVYSIIKVDNVASIKVAEAIGMSQEDEFITQYYNGDMLHYLFSVEKF
ncbi:MAG TPA: GNAT family N-acetyltransferase [Firmicutes bacterium]|nr:GNAT family N-acetyltransferase [Bacillota bacterium]